MPLSGKTAVALAKYYESHFEWTYFGDPKGQYPRAICIDELCDFFIEGEYSDAVIEWAAKIPKQRDQIRLHVLAARKDTALLLRFAQDILNRTIPGGRYDDKRGRERLLAALQADGYTFVDGQLVGTPEAIARAAQDAADAAAAKASAPPATRAVAIVAPAPILTDRECMARTVALARKCVPEDTTKPMPRVAALIVRNGIVLGEAYRGELGDGDHAEYTLLKKKLDTPFEVAGATLFTTLEPCTQRNPPKVECVERVLGRKIARVVVGTVDPNPDVLGKGLKRLREANINVSLYDDDFVAQLEEMNEEFYRAHRRPK